jgi:hypothetical protein
MWGTQDLLERQQKRWWGFAHLFRPTYAEANVGHPSSTCRISVEFSGAVPVGFLSSLDLVFQFPLQFFDEPNGGANKPGWRRRTAYSEWSVSR